MLESDTEGENADDLIGNLGTVGTLDTLRDLEDYDGFPGRMNGGSVDEASRSRSRSPTPHPEPGAIRRLGPVPDVLAHYSGVTTFSWAAAGVGAAFREALTRAPLSAAVPFQVSPDMTVCLCPPGGDVCEHALDQVHLAGGLVILHRNHRASIEEMGGAPRAECPLGRDAGRGHGPNLERYGHGRTFRFVSLPPRARLYEHRPWRRACQ